jgi:prophage CP4-57-like integrase
MAKKVKPLVDTEIKKAKASNKPYTLTDGYGLFLIISPTGSKSWRFNYYRPLTKKRAKISLGLYPAITLSKARELREQYRQLLANKIDPQEYIKQHELLQLQRQNNTFFAISTQWKQKKVSEIKFVTLKSRWRTLEKYAFPYLGDNPIAEITPQQLHDTAIPLFERGVSHTGKLVIALVNEIMNFAVNKGIIEFNKCINVSKAFNVNRTTHHPTIRPEKLPEFMSALRHSHIDLMVKYLIEFSLLTITRPSEAANAQWNEIDFEKSLWNIPAERMKMKKAFTIPLSPQVLKILNKLKNISGRSRFIFQSQRYPERPLHSSSANAAIKRVGYKDQLTSHGLRSIASTYLSETFTEMNLEILEACLSHQSKNQVRNAYNRSTYLEQRKPLMNAWGDFVEECMKKSI